MLSPFFFLIVCKKYLYVLHCFSLSLSLFSCRYQCICVYVYVNFCSWHTKRANNEESIQHLLATGRAKIKDGTLIVTAVDKSDNGPFYCTATNSEGSETLELQMSVTSPLTASVQPTVQTVNLGQTAELV